MMVRSTPLSRLTDSSDHPAARSALTGRLGKSTNSPMDSATANITASPITILSTPVPSLSASHFSNLEGSSSSRPAMSALADSTFMPSDIIITMLTAPRMIGQPIHLCFFAIDVTGSCLIRRLPSARRTAMAMASLERIITPSKTACPP